MSEPGPGEMSSPPDAVTRPVDPLHADAGAPQPGGPHGRTPRRADRHKRPPGRHPWMRRGIIIVASVLALVLALGVVAYFKLSGNITTLDIAGQLGARPKSDSSVNSLTHLKAENILVMGSDTRALGTRAYGVTAGARSDTTLLVHLAADRKSAIVVSIPRDSMTKAPQDCKNTHDSVQDGVIRQWNANYDLGGPACTIRTFEGDTGIFVDHFMVVNFIGFQSMVDALGTVPICVPKAIDDKKAHLKLPAGRSELDGKQALAYVRARYSLGDGSDISRIGRQQTFLSSMVQTATSANLLFRPDRLFRFLDAATKSLTTDPGLANLNALRELAQSAQGLKSSQIRFVTVPTEPYPADPNRVQWTQGADLLWQTIKADQPLPGTTPAKAATARPTPSPSGEPLTVRPSKILVYLTNDSGTPGVARLAANALQLQGFNIMGYKTGLSGGQHQGVIIRYRPDMYDSARTVAAAFPGSVLKPDQSLGKTIEISVGVNSPSVVAVPNRRPGAALPSRTTATATQTFKARTANTDICSAS